MKKITIKLTDGSKMIFKKDYEYISLDELNDERKKFIYIGDSYIKKDSILNITIENLENEIKEEQVTNE